MSGRGKAGGTVPLLSKSIVEIKELRPLCSVSFTLLFISTKHVNTDMSKEQTREDPSEEVISMDELTEILAEAEGVTPEEIEQGAEELDLAPPEEATVLNE